MNFMTAYYSNKQHIKTPFLGNVKISIYPLPIIAFCPIRESVGQVLSIRQVLAHVQITEQIAFKVLSVLKLFCKQLFCEQQEWFKDQS